MFLLRLRRPGLERVEQALIQLFSSERGAVRGITKETGERLISGSLGIYAAPIGGKAIFALAYDNGGADFPAFLVGWRGSLEEIEAALRMAEQGIEALMSPLTFATHPALLNPTWEGWGPTQAAVYLSFFFGLTASSSALRPPDATGVG